MGVPNSKFKGDSDYKASYLENKISRTSNTNKPSDQLVPEGNIESSTEKKESYKVINNELFYIHILILRGGGEELTPFAIMPI